MNPIKLRIKYDAQDGYLYGGRLFLICNDGAIKSVPLWKVISSNLNSSTTQFHLFELAFNRNNWLNNNQAKTILGIEGLRNQLKKEWDKFSKIEFHFTINEEDLTLLSKVKRMPVFDFKLYGMRMFLGDRTGLYEAGVSINGDSDVRMNESLERVLDSRTTGITGKSGSLMISSNSDGLFHGRFNQIDKRVKIYKKPVKPVSLRTGWTGYDVINYETQRDFNYLKNDYAKDEKRRYLYSSGDEGSKKIRINKIAEETIPMDELFSNIEIDLNDIIYSFNSTKSCFFFLKDGRFVNSYWNKYYGQNKNIKLRSVLHDLPKNNGSKKINKPISSHIVPNGCVIEFIDKVILIHDKKKIILEDSGVTSIRTFPASIRYRNLISIFDGEGISIHSIPPFEE